MLLWAEAMARRVRLLLVLASERVEKRVYGKAQTEDHNDNGDGERSGGEMEDGSPARTRIHSSSMSTVAHSTARSLPAWPLLSAESKGTLRLVDWASRPGQFSFSTLRQPPHRSPRRHRDFCSTPRRESRRRHPHHRSAAWDAAACNAGHETALVHGICVVLPYHTTATRSASDAQPGGARQHVLQHGFDANKNFTQRASALCRFVWTKRRDRLRSSETGPPWSDPLSTASRTTVGRSYSIDDADALSIATS